MEAVVFIVKQQINYRWWKYIYATRAEMFTDKLLLKLYLSLSLTSSLPLRLSPRSYSNRREKQNASLLE